MNHSKKKISRKAKIIILSALALFAIALAFGVNYLITYVNYERDTAAIQIQNVDLTTIGDGEFFGEVDVGFIRASVRVVIENHVITELELLEHYNDRGAAANLLPDRILEAQRIDVDAVSGATQSSKVIQEAVFRALTGESTIGR